MAGCKRVRVLAPLVSGGLVLGLLFAGGAAVAATYIVYPDGSGDYPTISLAMAAAADGDVIELADGVFRGPGNRDLDFSGKSLVVRSQNGQAASCIIECDGAARGFAFTGGESPWSVLEGITIRNGASTHGGAVLCANYSNPILRRCAFRSCRATVGGGVYCNESFPLLEQCVFEANEASYGGGIACRSYAAPAVLSCTLIGNRANRGGALSSEYNAWPMLDGCTLVGNDAPSGAGVYCAEEASLLAERTIIAFNTLGRAVHCLPGISVSLSCCLVFGNEGGDWVGCLSGLLGVDGNIEADPGFCDAGSGDLTLSAASPCVHFAWPNEDCDLIGAWGVGCGHALVTPDGSGDFATLQAAIDELGDGDVICLASGTYSGNGNRDVDLQGKGLRILPLDVQGPPPRIDCQGAGSGFRCTSGEGSGTVLSGLWIEHAQAAQGAAIACIGSSPSISRCVLRANTADRGAGIQCAGRAQPRIERVTFQDNAATHSGGALVCDDDASPRLIGCSLSGNRAPTGSGIACHGAAEIVIDRTIIAFGRDGQAVACGETAAATLTCCDLYGNSGGDWTGSIADQLGHDGNISADPLFCSQADLTLDDRSPCGPLHPENNCGVIGAWPTGCHAPMILGVDPAGGGEFATIQAAIDFARPGDTVELSDGIFIGPGNYYLDFHGKAITLRSASDDPEACIIDCQEMARALTFTRAEGPCSVVRGIMLRRGRAAAG